MSRPTALAVAVLAAAALAAAAAARDPRDPREAFTRADRAWAERIVLKGSDLPGRWRAAGPTSEDAGCPSFDPDMSDLTLTGEAKSPDFGRGAVVVSSAAQVFRTAREAAASFRRGARPAQVVACYDDAFRTAVGRAARVRLVSGGVVPGPRVGERRLALRMVWELRLEGATARTYLEVVGWDRGRASAVLAVLSGGRPPDYALERRLVQRMDARMRR